MCVWGGGRARLRVCVCVFVFVCVTKRDGVLVCVCWGGACVCVCRGVLYGGCNLSVHGFHHREVMCMAEATNDGVRERKCP